MRTPRFQSAFLQVIYDQTLAAAEVEGSTLFRDGQTHRSNSTACAFDDGVKNKRSLHSIQGQNAGSAIFAAGREWAKRHKK